MLKIRLTDSCEAVFFGIDDINELDGSIIVTGFRGFGMVGYLISKYVALGLNSRKIGFIVLKNTPPLILVEEDGVGFPFDIYFDNTNKILTIVNRALPEKEQATEYARAIAGLASMINARFLVLGGGLNKDFMEEVEEHGYRHLPNRFYKGPMPKAPRMEEGLGVMGPLALLFIFSEYYEIPSIIILPYSTVEDVDYDAALRGVEIVGNEILGTEIDTSKLKEEASKYREAREKLASLIVSAQEEVGGERRERHGGMYM